MVPLFEYLLCDCSLLYPLFFSLILNESVIQLAKVKSEIALLASKAGSSLQYCYKIKDVFE